MDKLQCAISHLDRFSSEILLDFIERTDNLEIHDIQNIKTIDLLFLDLDFYEDGLSKDVISHVNVIVVSSNKKYVNSLFKNEISDFIYKPDLSYSRFLKTIEIVRGKKNVKLMPS